MPPYPPLDFSTIRWFTADELPSGYVDPVLVGALDAFREGVGAPVVLHDLIGSGHEPNGQHPRGKASDLHVVGVSLIDAWLAAERFPVFRGIGLYPWWAHPGLHLDVRDTPYRARWWRDHDGRYRALDAAALVAMLPATA